ncbi:hypothetical protein C0J52_18509 [Blattella germanica]|nr:hypothetical protein C0J52_18509 [Blattella germanica]
MNNIDSFSLVAEKEKMDSEGTEMEEDKKELLPLLLKNKMKDDMCNVKIEPEEVNEDVKSEEPLTECLGKSDDLPLFLPVFVKIEHQIRSPTLIISFLIRKLRTRPLKNGKLKIQNELKREVQLRIKVCYPTAPPFQRFVPTQSK